MNTENNLVVKTFFWMFLGLLATALTSFLTYSSGLLETILTKGSFDMLLILEIVVVIAFSFFSRKLPATVVSILYFIYAIINGLTMSSVFYVFELNSIVLLFAITALLFGGLALYGYKTNKDLTKIGTILMAVLIVGLIVSIINIFVGNTLIDIIIDWVILFVFFGITAYDMNKIKNGVYNYLDTDRAHIYAAMDLYLDFINIFLRLLSIFGKRND